MGIFPTQCHLNGESFAVKNNVLVYKGKREKMKWSILLPMFLGLPCTAMAKESHTVMARVTAYCPGKCCCGDYAGKKRGQTASGKMAKQGRTLAMPRGIPFGTQVLEDGKLLGVCEDRGGAIKAEEGYICIDVYMDSHAHAVEHGVRWSVVTIKHKEVKHER